MTSKATQEYRLSFITLISQLSEIERKGNELFDKIEKSGWVAYDPSTAQNDFEQLLGSLQQLESHARTCGLLSISGTVPGDSQTQTTRNLATRSAETSEMVNTFFQEKSRLLMNIRAAATAASTSTGHN